MNPLLKISTNSGKLLDRVRHHAGAEECRFYLERMRADLVAVTDLGAAVRIEKVLVGVTRAFSRFFSFPIQATKKNHFVVLEVEKLVQVVTLEIYRTR